MKRKRKNGEPSFIAWQLKEIKDIWDEIVEEGQKGWNECPEKRHMFFWPPLIPAVVFWVFCGLLPSLLFGWGWGWSLSLCFPYPLFILWLLKRWLDGRINKYYEEMDGDEKH